MTAGPLCPITAVTVLALALAASPAEDFARARTAFFRAEYHRAIELLHPLLYPELRLESEEEAVQAHRMLGVAYLFEHQPAQARREFRKLLELRPDYRFDPLLDPPRVVDFFNDVLKAQESELAEIEARRKKRQAGTVLVERRYERLSMAVNFIPFGAGQFQNGQRRKGWAFLAAESALAAGSLAALTANFALFGVRPIRPCKDLVMPGPDGTPGTCAPDSIDHTGEDLSRNLVRVQVATGALFFGVAIWGVVDAVRNFRPEVAVDVPISPVPATTSASSPSAAPPPDRHHRAADSPPPLLSRLRLYPTLSPLSQGAALIVTF